VRKKKTEKKKKKKEHKKKTPKQCARGGFSKLRAMKPSRNSTTHTSKQEKEKK
jgi:hypothetical protein